MRKQNKRRQHHAVCNVLHVYRLLSGPDSKQNRINFASVDCTMALAEMQEFKRDAISSTFSSCNFLHVAGRVIEIGQRVASARWASTKEKGGFLKVTCKTMTTHLMLLDEFTKQLLGDDVSPPNTHSFGRN